jgi:hypothetical protein
VGAGGLAETDGSGSLALACACDSVGAALAGELLAAGVGVGWLPSPSLRDTSHSTSATIATAATAAST